MEHAMDTGIFLMVYGVGVSMHSGPFFRVGVARVIIILGFVWDSRCLWKLPDSSRNIVSTCMLVDVSCTDRHLQCILQHAFVHTHMHTCMYAEIEWGITLVGSSRQVHGIHTNI